MLSNISYPVLIVAAVVMAIMPSPEHSHLVEKVGMLARGELKRPIDIFDLFLHSAPIILIVIKLVTERLGK